jgi:hypothetical protein
MVFKRSPSGDRATGRRAHASRTVCAQLCLTRVKPGFDRRRPGKGAGTPEAEAIAHPDADVTLEPLPSGRHRVRVRMRDPDEHLWLDVVETSLPRALIERYLEVHGPAGLGHDLARLEEGCPAPPQPRRRGQSARRRLQGASGPACSQRANGCHAVPHRCTLPPRKSPRKRLFRGRRRQGAAASSGFPIRGSGSTSKRFLSTDKSTSRQMDVAAP